jgi:hypothetical protein
MAYCEGAEESMDFKGDMDYEANEPKSADFER